MSSNGLSICTPVDVIGQEFHRLKLNVDRSADESGSRKDLQSNKEERRVSFSDLKNLDSERLVERSSFSCSSNPLQRD